MPLRVVAWLAESRLGGPLRAKMIRDAGLWNLAEAQLSEAPSYWPPFPTQAELAGHAVLDVPALPRPESMAQFESIADFTRAYREGTTTPSAVAERVLDATRDSESKTPRMRIFIAQSADDVRAQAAESSRRYRAGSPLGPLDGVPIAVKDEVDQVPYATTVGTRFLGQGSAKEDATVVARLRAAGALLIGKTNMHEIGIGVTGLNPHHGTPRNPYDPSRHTGGSSSGSAAAVAAGLCPVAVAADGGGSIRIPAAFCGMVGLKPTFGRVSEFGAAPLCWSVAHLGPVANCVEDAALVYRFMAGADTRDLHSVGQPAPTLEGLGDMDLSPVRIGVFRDWFEDAETPVVAHCDRALQALVARGATICPIDPGDLELARLAHLVTIATEMTESQRPHFEQHLKDYGADTRLLFALVRSFPPTIYVAAQRVRTRVAQAFARAFQDVDVIATPSTGCIAPTVPADALDSGESNLALLDRIMRFAPIANLLGLPAISVPVGYESGLPVGLQFIGRAYEEHSLLRLAAALQGSVERRLPLVQYRLLS